MKAFASLSLTALGFFTIFGPTLANNWESSSKHHYSVHSIKTHHRAKTTPISNSMPLAIPSPTCTSVPAGAKDTPAIREPGVNIVFRTSCGTTEETVHECPFLCGPGSMGSMKACFHKDISKDKHNDKDKLCHQCLPPCKFKDDKPPASTPPPATQTCTSVKPGETDTPASKDSGTGLLYRNSCGITHESVDECPYLCAPGNFGEVGQCFDLDYTGFGPNPVQCSRCLPPCKKD